MRRFVAILGCALLIVVFAAGPTAAKKGGTDRPYKGSYSGQIGASTGTFPGPLTVPLTASGHETHLGATTFQATAVGSFVGPCPGGLVFEQAQSATVTAANGDRLFETILLEPQCVVFGSTGTGDGTVTITGGTGRFAGATGTLSLHSTFDLSVSPGTFETVVKGTISY